MASNMPKHVAWCNCTVEFVCDCISWNTLSSNATETKRNEIKETMFSGLTFRVFLLTQG
jgi:hypothetical protein